MPYPLLRHRIWNPDRTALCWLTISTTDPAADYGMLLEVAVTTTGWDYEPVQWKRWLIRPVTRDWIRTMNPDRAVLFAENGLIDALGGKDRPLGLTHPAWGAAIGDVMPTKLPKWWEQRWRGQRVPVLAGPNAQLTLPWIEHYAPKFAQRIHPSVVDTLGVYQSLTYDLGMPDPCPTEPEGRALPDLYRSLTAYRYVLGLGPPAFPIEYVTPILDDTHDLK